MISGGDRGTRTPNLGDANAALSQLSYIPTPAHGSPCSLDCNAGLTGRQLRRAARAGWTTCYRYYYHIAQGNCKATGVASSEL